MLLMQCNEPFQIVGLDCNMFTTLHYVLYNDSYLLQILSDDYTSFDL